jgi:hypothetical protein
MTDRYVIWTFWINTALVLATLIIAVFTVLQARAAKVSADALIKMSKIPIALFGFENSHWRQATSDSGL